jgi:hypothetical protein
MFVRLLSTTAAHARSTLARRSMLVVAFAVAVVSALSLAAPAGAVVTTVAGSTVGLAPRLSKAYVKGAEPKTFANPSGNPVLHGTNVYAVYWDPTDHYWSEWQNAIDEYFQNAGTASGSLESVFAVDTQYTDKSNVPASNTQEYKGSYVDYHAYPASGCTDPEPFEPEDQIARELGGTPEPICLTSTEIADELEAFIAAHGLPKGMSDVYYLLTPPGVTVCLDSGGPSGYCSDDEEGNEASYDHSFCSYHSDINPGNPSNGSASTIIYAVVPWSAGGNGAWNFGANDQKRGGWECEDGGIVPTSKGYEVEEAKRTEAEQKAFTEMDAEEKVKAEEALALKGAHLQEPNQKPCPGTAGTCAYGLSDPIINQISLEQQDIVTDPLLNAWQDSHHYEDTDECRFYFGPALGGSPTAAEGSLAGTLFDQRLAEHEYYLNDAFSLAAYRLPYPGVPCVNHVNLDPKFTAPNPVKSGEVVGFDGMESDIELDAAFNYSSTGVPQANYATYTWNFGDGSAEVAGFAPGSPTCETPWLTPCAATVFHSYQYGGTYQVTLTVRDVGGNVASVSHEVTVVGPPPPSSTGSGAGAGSSAGGAGSSTGTSTTGAGATTGVLKAVIAPVAAAAIVHQSLKNALRKGLVVTYSVNEQVAGRFEVLLSRAVAHKLGITGTPATGLPAGSPAEVVIAKAILVTTKGGRSTVHIQFSKRTAAKLARVHKASLTLRMIVRNAATSDPATTTVVTAVTLSN